MHSISRDGKSLLARVAGAAGLLLFVSAFFAAPLANAFLLCTMTCCHHASAPKMVSEQATPCGTPECTISAPDVTMPAASVASAQSPAIINIDMRVASTSASICDAEVQFDTSPPGAGAPIHILNSVFRI